MITSFLRRIFLSVILLAATPALAVDTGLDAAAPDALKNIGTDVPTLVGGVLGQILGFTGTIFFVLVVYAGILWMTAAGNEEQTTKAKKILGAAVIGLIIVLSAYAITRFIGDTLG